MILRLFPEGILHLSILFYGLLCSSSIERARASLEIGTAEISAASIVIQYWITSMNVAVWITILLVLVVVQNPAPFQADFCIKMPSF